MSSTHTHGPFERQCMGLPLFVFVCIFLSPFPPLSLTLLHLHCSEDGHTCLVALRIGVAEPVMVVAWLAKPGTEYLAWLFVGVPNIEPGGGRVPPGCGL